MEEKNKITRELIRIGQIVLGNTMYALAVVMFIVPNGLITGGTTGLALFASHTVGCGKFVNLCIKRAVG